MKLSLDVLLRRAEVAAKEEVPQRKEKIARLDIRARLVAQEYARNGLDFRKAWETVTGKPSPPRRSMASLLGDSINTFVAEIEAVLRRADIDRDQALSIMWAVVNASLLDYMDDDGSTLSVERLRKLPRVMQSIITKIKVKTIESPVADSSGQPLMDDNGKPHITRSQYVELELMDKQDALDAIAKIMHWNAPDTEVNLFSIGTLMQHADQRAATYERTYQDVDSRPGIRPDAPALPE